MTHKKEITKSQYHSPFEFNLEEGIWVADRKGYIGKSKNNSEEKQKEKKM